jgi:hypothetical protein
MRTDIAAIEAGAIVLSYSHCHPITPGMSPLAYWEDWSEPTKARYRAEVRAVLAAVEAGDADAGLPLLMELSDEQSD